MSIRISGGSKALGILMILSIPLILESLGFIWNEVSTIDQLIAPIGVLFIGTIVLNLFLKYLGRELVSDSLQKRQALDPSNRINVNYTMPSGIAMTPYKFIIIIILSAIQATITGIFAFYMKAVVDYFIVNFILYGVLIKFTPRLLKSYALGDVYHDYKHYTMSYLTEDAVIEGQMKSVRHTFYFPLKVSMIRLPSKIYDLNNQEAFSIVRETDRSQTYHDITSIFGSNEDTLTIVKTKQTQTCRLVNLNNDTLLTVTQEVGITKGDFIVQSPHAKYYVDKKTFLSRQFSVYKDQQLYLRTLIKRHYRKKVLMIESFHEDNPGISIALALMILYGYTGTI